MGAVEHLFVETEQYSQRVVDTLDVRRQTSYWFDFETVERTVEAEAAKIARKRQEEAERLRSMKKEELREDVFAFWRRNGAWHGCDDDEDDQWGALRHRLAAEGVEGVPNHHKCGAEEFRIAMSAVLSAKEGKPVGFAYDKLIQVAHLLAERHRRQLLPFGWALAAYGTKGVVDGQDRTKKWKDRTRGIRAAIGGGDPNYRLDDTWSDVLQFLFPEIAEKIRRATPRPF